MTKMIPWVLASMAFLKGWEGGVLLFDLTRPFGGSFYFYKNRRFLHTRTVQYDTV